MAGLATGAAHPLSVEARSGVPAGATGGTAMPMSDEDLLIITADHGNDPTFGGNDHTREYIPILHFGARIKAGYNIGERASFADIAASIAESLEVPFVTPGKSYFQEISC